MYASSFTASNALQLIFYLAVLVGVLFVTYYVTKWIANTQKTQLYNTNFEVIETMKVSGNKFLQIVRVGTQDYYVIAIGKDEINMLGKLDKSQIEFKTESNGTGTFADILKSFKKDKGDTKDED